MTIYINRKPLNRQFNTNDSNNQEVTLQAKRAVDIKGITLEEGGTITVSKEEAKQVLKGQKKDFRVLPY